MPGSLSGVRIIELVGIGPGPFAAMMLADHGAEVISVYRPGFSDAGPLMRNRRNVVADMKTAEGLALVKQLVGISDGIIEGFRPGVMERLGLGPDSLHAINPRLVLGRMTGWGQDGPLALRAGHDINYISTAGVLHCFGNAGGPPVPPANLLGDFGGGGMLLAFGMVAAILNARSSGKGQVVDCAMVDGAATLGTLLWGLRASGDWSQTRGSNMLDTGAPFYNCYETADGKWVAVGAIEPQFYSELCRLTGHPPEPELDGHFQATRWPALKDAFSALFLTRTRDEWSNILEATDACVSAVLTMDEAQQHPHIKARNTLIEVGGVVQPAPSPRFSETPAAVPVAAREPDADRDYVLSLVRREGLAA